MKVSTVLLAVLFVGGCTWVKLTEQGALVGVRDANEVAGCEQLGRTTSTTRAKVVVGRNAEKVASELRTLAQNEAAHMGGNVIVPEGEPVEGRQGFGIYRC